MKKPGISRAFSFRRTARYQPEGSRFSALQIA